MKLSAIEARVQGLRGSSPAPDAKNTASWSLSHAVAEPHPDLILSPIGLLTQLAESRAHVIPASASAFASRRPHGAVSIYPEALSFTLLCLFCPHFIFFVEHTFFQRSLRLSCAILAERDAPRIVIVIRTHFSA